MTQAPDKSSSPSPDCSQFVIVTLRVPGFHRWPDAPPVVAYLAQRHRHEFVFRLEARVWHSDRDIEFHILKTLAMTELMNAYASNGLWCDFGTMSCEQIAEALHALLVAQGIACTAIEVWEDGENGARVVWNSLAIPD